MSARFLIVAPSWVGDMVMAQSLFKLLKQYNADCQIDVLAPKWSAPIVARMPEVQKLIQTSFSHGKLDIGLRWRMAQELRQDSYSHTIVLPNSLKSSLIPALARIPVRTGFLGEQRWGLLNDVRKLDKSSLLMTVQRFAALGLPSINDGLKEFPLPLLQKNSESTERTLSKFRLNKEEKLIIMCPGAEFGEAKKWPAPKYAEAAIHFSNEGYKVILLGSKADQIDCSCIVEGANAACRTLAGDTSLEEAMDIISLADLVVTNDSGLMHIAAGFDRPVVAIFGSTDPTHTPPLGKNNRIVQHQLSCQPCFKRQCPLQHLNCLNKLSVRSVVEAADSLLA